MPPQFALLLCAIFVLFVLIFDKRLSESVSGVIWIPVMWMMILGSRNISQWYYVLSNSQVDIGASQAYLEGNSIDRFILSLFVIAGIITLARRQVDLLNILKRNAWIILFFGFAAHSLIWSDYPSSTLRRLVKGFGTMIMIMVILTEKNPSEAVKISIRRCAYILIPLSIIFIKYFPDIGRLYSIWTGEVTCVGVTTSKNMLAKFCFITELVFLISIMNMRKTNWVAECKWKAFINLSYLGMIGWLMIKAYSATSVFCLGLGFLIFVLTGLAVMRKNFRIIDIMSICIVTGFLLTFFIFNLVGPLSKGLGRDATLTGRTELWADLLRIDSNQLIGVGYESFWLGERLDALWERYWWRPNQAHNGYIEVYLNLGLVGVFLLSGVILHTYRKIRRTFYTDFDFGRLEISFLISILLYNVTDVGFNTFGFVGFVFFLTAMENPLIKHEISLTGAE